MGVYVTFINPSVPHKAENLYLGWDFKAAVAFHKGLVMHGKVFIQKTDECVVIGTQKEGTIQMDATKVHWILEEANIIEPTAASLVSVAPTNPSSEGIDKPA